jgi:hypothetical protein
MNDHRTHRSTVHAHLVYCICSLMAARPLQTSISGVRANTPNNGEFYLLPCSPSMFLSFQCLVHILELRVARPLASCGNPCNRERRMLLRWYYPLAWRSGFCLFTFPGQGLRRWFWSEKKYWVRFHLLISQTDSAGFMLPFNDPPTMEIPENSRGFVASLRKYIIHSSRWYLAYLLNQFVKLLQVPLLNCWSITIFDIVPSLRSSRNICISFVSARWFWSLSDFLGFSIFRVGLLTFTFILRSQP